jgi:hypothetical protein
MRKVKKSELTIKEQLENLKAGGDENASVE